MSHRLSSHHVHTIFNAHSRPNTFIWKRLVHLKRLKHSWPRNPNCKDSCGSLPPEKMSCLRSSHMRWDSKTAPVFSFYGPSLWPHKIPQDTQNVLLPHPPLPGPISCKLKPMFELNQERGSERWVVTQPGRTSLLVPLTLTFLVRSQASFGTEKFNGLKVILQLPLWERCWSAW